MSFDVESLFTSVPIEPSIEIIKKLLEDDKSLHLRTKKYGIDVHLKGGHTIKDHLMSPKDKDPLLKKVGSYTGISVTGLIVMMNILVSQLEILKRG